MQFVEANGAKIPAIGLGTWELRGRTCARLVEQALRLGYRHVDTAQVYENEREVGEGLRASRVRRDDVFVTTKVWTTHFAPNDLERSTKESLTKLRLSEVDCARHGMALVAYSPVAKGRIKGEATLARIGQAYGKTAAQVCLRWLVQQNVSAIPRTSRIEGLSGKINGF